MNAALSWIGDLIHYISGFFPRIIIVRPYEKYVRFRLGKHISIIDPGILWYCPSLTGIDQVYTSWQVVTTPSLPYRTHDNQTVTASATCRYRIVDPIAYSVENNNPSESMVEEIATELGRVIAEHSLGELSSGSKLFRVAKVLERYGIETDMCRILLVTPGFHLIQTSPESTYFGAGDAVEEMEE